MSKAELATILKIQTCFVNGWLSTSAAKAALCAIGVSHAEATAMLTRLWEAR